MPNANSVTSSNNQNTANPSERLSGFSISAIRMRIIEQEECNNRFREYVNRIREYENRLREVLANRQYPNPNDELLRFSEDDIDSNIDSDVDNDIDIDRDWQGLIEENGMTFENQMIKNTKK